MPRAATTSDVFNAIAEPRRRQILDLLARRGALGVGAMVAALGLPQPAVSKHLAVLNQVGVVSATRDGRQRMFRLEAKELKAVHDWANKFERYWSLQLDRIKERAERKAREVDGRVETRRLWATEWTKWYQDRAGWKDLCSFVCVESLRTTGDQTSSDRRYFITDLNSCDPKALLGHVRGHWGVENPLHWSLDVTFQEDTRRNRVGYSAENFSRIRRLALNLLRRNQNCKAGIKGKRLKACLVPDYLLEVVSQEI